METRYSMVFQKRDNCDYEKYIVEFLECISQIRELDMTPYYWGTSEIARGRLRGDQTEKALKHAQTGGIYFASKNRGFRIEIDRNRYLKTGSVIQFTIDFDDFEPNLIKSAFVSICGSLNPTFAFVSSAEYFSKWHTIHKTIVKDGEILANATALMGTWIDDRLPGLYWLNMFGKECEYEGIQNRITHSLGETTALDCGTLIEMNFDIDSMNDSSVEEMLDEGRKLLGEELFFDPKAAPRIIEF